MIGMYGPSFFTGSLIQRFGVLNVILAGIAILLGCIGAALWLVWQRRAAVADAK
jgi:hypothetical protein